MTNATNINTEDGSSKLHHPKVSACVDCKRLKVKCVRSVAENANSPCLRCIKKNIECVTMGSLKRYNGDSAAGAMQHRKRRHGKGSSIKDEPLRNQLLFSWKLLTTRDDRRIQLLEKYDFASLARPNNNALKLGLLTQEQIIQRLNVYKEHMYPKFPVVELPADMGPEQLMATAPVLFHTVLDIASLMISDERQLETSVVLHNMVLRTVIDEIIVVSVKSLELLKCLVLLTVWYNESELYHQQRLHVLTTLSASVSYDLGMGGATLPKDLRTQAPAFEQMVAPQAGDAHNFASYKTWLAVYSTSFQSLMANRIPQKSMWNEYTKRAIKSLTDYVETTGNQEPSIIYDTANLRHLQETITQTLFKKDNEPHPPDFGDPSTQQVIHQFDMQIEEFASASSTVPRRKAVAIMLCKVFLHQGVLYTKYDSNLGRAPFTNFSLNLTSGPLSYQAVASFTKCIQYTKNQLDLVLVRPLFSLASETTNFWSTLILACDILMKCRACCIFNRYYAGACFVKEEDLGRVVAFVSLCDTLVKEFPNCNNAISFGFFIKLILCHHDARVHYHTTRIPVENQGDPEFVEKIVKASSRNNSRSDASLERQDEQPSQPSQDTQPNQQLSPHTTSQPNPQQTPQWTPQQPVVEPSASPASSTNAIHTDGEISAPISTLVSPSVTMNPSTVSPSEMDEMNTAMAAQFDCMNGYNAPVNNTPNAFDGSHVSHESSPFSPFDGSYSFNLEDGVQRTLDMVEPMEFDEAVLSSLNDLDSFLPNTAGKWEPSTFWTLFSDMN